VKILHKPGRILAAVAMLATLAPLARAAEHITLANGFELDCVRREVVGDKVRLYLSGNGQNYMEVAASAVVRVETIPDPPPAPVVPAPLKEQVAAVIGQPTAEELKQLLERAGAQGLMQLMPGTALALGVKDAFAADQNVEGGTKYLDQMLTRYHDNIALALAAYNAGPAAVDRFHGVPPYRETRAYVARIIREFNRRKTTLLAQSK
jgi:hypothetical protein